MFLMFQLDGASMDFWITDSVTEFMNLPNSLTSNDTATSKKGNENL